MTPRLLFLMGLYWPMLVAITGNYTASQIIFALAMSLTSLFIIAWHRRLNDPRIFWTIVAGFFLATLVASIGLVAGGSITRSLSDGTRFLFLSIYISAGYLFAISEARSQRAAIRILTTYLIASVLFSTLVYFPSLYPMLDLFKGRLSNDELQFHFFRFSGFSGFPTDFGALLALGLCLILCDERGAYLSRATKVALLAVMTIGLAGSASRGAILHAAAVVGLAASYAALRWITSLRTSRAAALAVLVTPLCAVLIYSMVQPFVPEIDAFRYLNVDFDSPDSSVSHRFQEIQGAATVLTEQGFLFGRDRDFPLDLPVIEGFWTHLLLRYSWLGLLIGVAMFGWSLRICLGSGSVLGNALGLWLLGFFLADGLFSDVLFRFKGPFVYGFLFGIVLHQFQVRRHRGRAHYLVKPVPKEMDGSQNAEVHGT